MYILICIKLKFLLNGTFIQCCVITLLDCSLRYLQDFFVSIGHIQNIRVTGALLNAFILPDQGLQLLRYLVPEKLFYQCYCIGGMLVIKINFLHRRSTPAGTHCGECYFIVSSTNKVKFDMEFQYIRIFQN